MTEILEVGEGVRGDPRDRKLTIGDLVDLGLARARSGAGRINLDNLEASLPELAQPDMATPPSPSGLGVSGGFNGLISLVWDIPGTLYGNHAYTNIYRAEEDNFANAVKVGAEAGAFFTDNVRADAEPKTYYYWITFVSTADVEGPTNATAGTAGQALQDVAYLLETLTNNLNDAPATLGAPDETLILHADRFALRTGPADDPVYPMVVQDINGTPTVVLDTAIIRDGAIQKGQIGAIGFGQIVDENDLPVTTVAGKLKGDLIEADNLKVAEAATFTGIAQSTNFATGLDGWLLNPNGQFEANNATFRGHVEMDTGHISETVQIGGTVASTVRDNASTARSRVDQWVKPGFTWIDGTQIYTGDAYVDTLQIKGQAVTFPRGTTNAGTLTLPNGAYHSVLSLYAAHTGAPIIVTVSINFPSRAQIYNSRETLSAVVKRGDTTLYGPVSLRSSVLDGTEAAFTPGVFGFSFYLPTSASGTYTVQLSGSSSTSVEISTRSITILEAKR
jgi:hypothetical protein